MLNQHPTHSVTKSLKKPETVSIADQSLARREARTLLEQVIRMRAHELYLARGAAPGDDVQDWLQAEREYFGVDFIEGPLAIAPSRRGHVHGARGS